MRTFFDLTPYEQILEEIVADGYPRIMVESTVAAFLHGVKERLRRAGDEIDIPRFGRLEVYLQRCGTNAWPVIFLNHDRTAWWFETETAKEDRHANN